MFSDPDYVNQSDDTDTDLCRTDAPLSRVVDVCLTLTTTQEGYK